MDEELKARYIAEAKFIRAYTYFNLVRIFGPVPKITVIFHELILPQSSVEEIYNDIIIPDLLAGIEILPEKSEYSGDDVGRITKGAANALLAKVYMHLNDFVNAEIYALEVISSTEYWLDPSFENVFSNTNSHGSGSIFELGALPFNKTLGGNQYGNTQGVRGEPNWGWGFGRPSWDLINSFEPGDPRLQATVIFLGDTIGGTLIVGNSGTSDTLYNDEREITEIECYSRKVQMDGAITTEDNFGYNRRIIRYADILLMAAEALNENGKPDDALIYLNLVRERARNGNEGILPDITVTEKSQLRNIIWKERRSELACEDERFFDLQRQGRMFEVLGKYGFIEGKHEILPIPQQEIDISEGKMQQNPAWIE
jgi:hypothetical protein